MEALANIPKWAREVIEVVGQSVEFSAPTELVWHFSPADENGWGLDLVEIAPATVELVEAGPNDGEQVYGLFHRLDLLQIQQDAFDKVEEVDFGFEVDSDKMRNGLVHPHRGYRRP